jgi:hypothetical protein
VRPTRAGMSLQGEPRERDTDRASHACGDVANPWPGSRRSSGASHACGDVASRQRHRGPCDPVARGRRPMAPTSIRQIPLKALQPWLLPGLLTAYARGAARVIGPARARQPDGPTVPMSASVRSSLRPFAGRYQGPGRATSPSMAGRFFSYRARSSCLFAPKPMCSRLVDAQRPWSGSVRPTRTGTSPA